MISLKEHITVNRSIDHAFNYVSDFKTIEQWDPGVITSIKETDGPTGIGSRYALKLCYGLVSSSITYTIVEYDKPFKVVLKGSAASYSVQDTIIFTSLDPLNTRINYQADITFSAPINKTWQIPLNWFLTRMGKRAMDGLKVALHPKVPRLPQSKKHRDMLDRSIIGGMPAFTRFGYSFSKKRWSPVAPTLDGKTVLLTGGTSGLGLAAAYDLAHVGAHIIFLARNVTKAQQMCRLIQKKTGNTTMDIIYADMSDLESVKHAAQNIIDQKTAVDVVINNAGALFSDRIVSHEGFEKTFVTNLLAPFTLTDLLIPVLKKSTDGRIINVSSGGMYLQRIHVDDLQCENEPFDGATAYARAKRGLVILSQYWAKKLANTSVSVHAMHPGWVDTPGLKLSLPAFYKIMKPVMRDPQQGADTIVWLAVAPEVSSSTGQFWLDRKPHVTHVLKRTRETPRERQALIDKLTHMMNKGAP